MKKIIAIFALGTLFLAACGAATSENSTVADASKTSILTMGMDVQTDSLPLEASFMSDYQTMVYTFNYEGNILKLIDTQLDGASEYGASFKVEGGAEITTSTVLADGFVAPEDFVDGGCEVSYETFPYEKEVLVLREKVCSADDVDMAEEAINSLTENLSMEAL